MYKQQKADRYTISNGGGSGLIDDTQHFQASDDTCNGSLPSQLLFKIYRNSDALYAP